MIALSPGTLLTGMVAMFVRATVSRTEMLADCASEINALSRFGVIAIRIGKRPTGISVTTWLVEVSITATLLEYLVGDKKGLGQSRGCEGKGENNQQQRQAICFHS